MTRYRLILPGVCLGVWMLIGASSALAVPVINSVTLNGGASVTVTPGASIAVAVTGTSPGNSSNDRWKSTHYQITGQSGVCVNTADVQNQSNVVRTFNVTAPAVANTYSITITLYSDDVCTNDASTPLTLTNSITVCPDDDGDGVCNANDGCPNDPNKTSPGQCGCGNPDTDSDGDGTANCNDACPNDADNDADGDGVCGDVDVCPGHDDNVDTDGDGVPDGCDICPGFDDNADADADGIPDGCDTCPNDSANDADGDGVCGDVDICPGFDDNADADTDGIPDGCDTCPNDADNDADGDGVCGDLDACPGTPGGETVNAQGCSCSQLNCDDGDPCTTDSCLNGVCSNVFADADGDGVCDANDTCPGTPGGETVNAQGCSCSQLNCDDGDPCTTDSCQDGVCSNVFEDADNDGVCDANDTCPGTPGGETVNAQGCSCSQLNCDDGDPCTTDSCQDGVCSNVFEDADGDGTCDANDACPNDPNNDADGDGVCGDVDVCPGFDDSADADSDGVPDGCDVCPGADDHLDTDTDGTPDCLDGCPNDAAKTAPGVCGCGTTDTDSDGDGTADCNDGCPADAAKTAPGVCGCGVADTDSDGDGTADCNDDCPADAAKTAPGECGCGVADTDSDGDGIADCNDDDEPAPAPTPDLCGTLNCAPGTAGMLPMLLAGMGLMRRRHFARR